MDCDICGKKTNSNRKQCGNCSVKIRRYRLKMASIEYKGGKCQRCGFNENLNCLDFHHLSNKSFGISSYRYISWKSIKKELDKCELLCSNCHRILHAERFDQEKIQAVASIYKGKPFSLAAMEKGYHTIDKCEDCGKEISYNAKHCKSCERKKRLAKSSKYPDLQTLINMVKETNYSVVGRKYNVTGTSIKKYINTRLNVNNLGQ